MQSKYKIGDAVDSIIGGYVCSPPNPQRITQQVSTIVVGYKRAEINYEIY